MIREYAKTCEKSRGTRRWITRSRSGKSHAGPGNKKTHVIEFAPRLMPRQLDDAGATILKNKLTSLGLSIHTLKHTYQVLGEEKVTGIQFADESELSVDMLVISTGIKARDELAVNVV